MDPHELSRKKPIKPSQKIEKSLSKLCIQIFISTGTACGNQSEICVQAVAICFPYSKCQECSSPHINQQMPYQLTYQFLGISFKSSYCTRLQTENERKGGDTAPGLFVITEWLTGFNRGEKLCIKISTESN